MSQVIEYTASLAPGANPNYAQVIVTDLHYASGGGVAVNAFLGIVFYSPVSITTTDFWATVDPWVATTPVIVSSDKIDADTYLITMRLEVAEPHTFGPGSKDILNWGINGDITQDTERYLSSFKFAADEIPDVTGAVRVHVAPAPDPGLVGLEQQLTFTEEGGRPVSDTVPVGQFKDVSLIPGTYTITASDLSTSDQTVSAPAQADPSVITVVTGETAALTVTYGPVVYHGAIDLVIEPLVDLGLEQLHVRVAREGDTLADFETLPESTTELRRLPPDGLVHISIDSIILNNRQYPFNAKEAQLQPSLIRVVFTQDDVIVSDIDPTGFVTLPIVVTTDVSFDVSIPVRLMSTSFTGFKTTAPSDFIYTQLVLARAGSTPFAVPVRPRVYSVQVTSFVHEGIIYEVNAPTELTVASDGSTVLGLTVVQGANLQVRGFPNFLSFGGCAKLVPQDEADFVAARTSSIFMYAGVSGDGDPEQKLPDDMQTRRIIQLARAVSATLGQPVLPVMVSYTCNLSGGDARTRLQNAVWLENSFGNFILALKIALEFIDEQNPVPAGFVVNPDFIGACQQDGIAPSYVMPVRAPLQAALDFRDVSVTIPDAITETLAGYVLAVNWLVRTVAPQVTFGWQINVWGVGTSYWLYSNGNEPTVNAQLTANYTRELGVFDVEAVGVAPPDFMAIDRYEADDFTCRSYCNSYCYGPREWSRFFDYCAAYSLDMKVPIMPWQIPASHIPLVTDLVDDLEREHWGTGGSYIFGDPNIGSDYHQVNEKILALQFPNNTEIMGKTAEEMFIRSEPFDITLPAYRDFLYRGIFAVLLGGGSTTGIVSATGDPSPWVRDRLNAYMDNPIPLNAARLRR